MPDTTASLFPEEAPAAPSAKSKMAAKGRKSKASKSEAEPGEAEALPESVAEPAPVGPTAEEAIGGRRSTAQQMATRQREISVSEFITKNRHLLGFDSPLKALLTAVKEAVDNSLDACEEAGILPEIWVELKPTTAEHFRMIVEDNGPGIVAEQIGKVFGKLLYGSKFHKLAQSRGQQGIGISAAGMYGQLTTGKPVRILSRTSKKADCHEFVMSIDTARNKPDIHESNVVSWERDGKPKEHGTKVEIEMEAKYQKGAPGPQDLARRRASAARRWLVRGQAGGDLVAARRRAQEVRPRPHGTDPCRGPGHTVRRRHRTAVVQTRRSVRAVERRRCRSWWDRRIGARRAANCSLGDPVQGTYRTGVGHEPRRGHLRRHAPALAGSADERQGGAEEPAETDHQLAQASRLGDRRSRGAASRHSVAHGAPAVRLALTR